MSPRHSLPESIRLMQQVYGVRLPANSAAREQALTAAVDTYLTIDAAFHQLTAQLAALQTAAPRLPAETEYYQEILIHEARLAAHQAQVAPLEQQLQALIEEYAAAENALIDLLPVGVSVRVGEYAVIIISDWRAGKYARVAPWQQRHITCADLTGGDF
jgi:hypothetical protein